MGSPRRPGQQVARAGRCARLPQQHQCTPKQRCCSPPERPLAARSWVQAVRQGGTLTHLHRPSDNEDSSLPPALRRPRTARSAFSRCSRSQAVRLGAQNCTAAGLAAPLLQSWQRSTPPNTKPAPRHELTAPAWSPQLGSPGGQTRGEAPRGTAKWPGVEHLALGRRPGQLLQFRVLCVVVLVVRTHAPRKVLLV
jgi:hypothetical protein